MLIIARMQTYKNSRMPVRFHRRRKNNCKKLTREFKRKHIPDTLIILLNSLYDQIILSMVIYHSILCYFFLLDYYFHVIHFMQYQSLWSCGGVSIKVFEKKKNELLIFIEKALIKKIINFYIHLNGNHGENKRK